MSKTYEEMTLKELEEMKRQALIKEFADKEKSKNADTAVNFTAKDMNMSRTVDSDEWKAIHDDYVNSRGGYVAYDFTNSDSGCDTDISDWKRSEYFVSMVWSGMYHQSRLLPIAVKGLDIHQGEGNVVKIRVAGKFGAPTSAAACECVSCSSNALSSYSITIGQYGLGAVLCNWEEFQVGKAYRESVLNGMVNSYKDFFDDTIYSELTGASAGHTETLSGALGCDPALEGSCCSDSSLSALYNATIALVADMREDDYSPDTMIVSPTVASILKRFSAVDSPFGGSLVSINGDGELVRFNGLKVIEFSGASTCTDASGAKMAVVIDSSRAVGVSFGKQPFLKTEESASCNSTEAYLWCYVGFSELDVNAIGFIVNP